MNKSRPILFSAPMVRAILAGRKTQTRRIVKQSAAVCPFGMAGDELWVRETWAKAKLWPICSEMFYRADGEDRGRQTALSYIEREARWRASIHMPRSVSRIALEITGVRVERLQEISEADAIAEGCTPVALHDLDCDSIAPSDEFRALWKSIHGPDSWRENPWVWVIAFTRIACGRGSTARNRTNELR